MKVKCAALKFYLEDSETVSIAEIIPLFHRWIQNKSVDGLLIDVADYSHMHQGPGVMLMGHDIDYSIDFGEGRPGLSCKMKGTTPSDLGDGVERILKAALVACQKLEHDEHLTANVQFHTGEVLLSVYDRLSVSNSTESVDDVWAQVQRHFNRLYQRADVDFQVAFEDPRAACSIRVQAESSPSLSECVSRFANS